MKILRKSEYNRAVLDSLFTTPSDGGTYACREKVRFDRGKYQAGIVGKDIDPVHEKWCAIVWAEPRKDKDGPYFALFCHRRRDTPEPPVTIPLSALVATERKEPRR